MEKVRRSKQQQTLIQILQRDLNVNDMTDEELWDLEQWLNDICIGYDVMRQDLKGA